jgi:type I restriction enzyme, R subunit
MPERTISPNFEFLLAHDQQLVRLGYLAERYFSEDPSTSLIKMRQFGETLAQLVAARAGMYRDTQEAQADVIRRLKLERVIPAEVGELFHHLRVAGNRATHEGAGTHGEALTALKIGRQLGIWFHRTFGAPKGFAPGPFTPPADPATATNELAAELAQLRTELDATRTAAERAGAVAEEEAKARLSAEDERSIWEQLAAEAEQAKAALATELQSLQAEAVAAPVPVVAAIVAKAQTAATELNIDEASTRALIDEQLRARGWAADTQTLRTAGGRGQPKGITSRLPNGLLRAGRWIMRCFWGQSASRWWKPSAGTRMCLRQ